MAIQFKTNHGTFYAPLSFQRVAIRLAEKLAHIMKSRQISTVSEINADGRHFEVYNTALFHDIALFALGNFKSRGLPALRSMHGEIF